MTDEWCAFTNFHELRFLQSTLCFLHTSNVCFLNKLPCFRWFHSHSLGRHNNIFMTYYRGLSENSSKIMGYAIKLSSDDRSDRVDHILTDAVHTKTHNNIITAKKYHNIWARDLNIFLNHPSRSLDRKIVLEEREKSWSYAQTAARMSFWCYAPLDSIVFTESIGCR